MEKIVKYLIILFLVMGLSTISSAVTLSNVSYTNNNLNANMVTEWTALYYLCGDNKLSALQQQVLGQIQSVGSTDQVQIAILIDQNQDADTKLYYLDGNDLISQEWEEESAMDDPITLEDFIQKVKTDLPSNNYYLQLSSNKGSGWQGVCYDQRGDGAMITMTELSTLLSTVTSQGGQKIDVIAVETCLGGNLEFAYQLKDYCNYYIGYADCGVGGSWPYQASLDALISDPGMSAASFASEIVDSFSPEDISQWKLMTAIGALDLGVITTVKNAIDELGQYFIDNMDEYQQIILSSLEDIRIYGEMWDIDYYIDMVQFLNNVEFNDQKGEDLREEIISSIDSIIINKNHLEKDDCEGFNFYFPRRSTDFNYALRYENGILPDNYEQTLFSLDTSWDDFLKEFLGIANNHAPDKPTITGPTEGKTGEIYEYSIASIDQENDNLYYFVDWGDDTASDWDGPYEASEQITFSHNWTEKGSYILRVKARDDKGAESEWSTLTITMPKSRSLALEEVNTILIGKISDIERNQNKGFRFLPLHLISIMFGGDQGVSFSVLDETHGGYPCCCYIGQDEFSGFLGSSFIMGIWSI